MLNEIKSPYYIDLALLISSVIALLLSCFCDYQNYKSGAEQFFWFQRSGSIVVILGVFLEVRQHSKTESTEIHDALGVRMFSSLSEMSSMRKILYKTAIALLVLGTLVWGYGDIPFKKQ